MQRSEVEAYAWLSEEQGQKILSQSEEGKSEVIEHSVHYNFESK